MKISGLLIDAVKRKKTGRSRRFKAVSGEGLKRVFRGRWHEEGR